MSYKTLCALFMLSFLASGLQAQANRNYTDHKPQYRPWQDNYILDKIEYKANETIFYFRFQSSTVSGSAVTYYAPGDRDAWYLKANNGKTYEMKALRNVRRNSELLTDNLRRTSTYENVGVAAAHTCAIHFERLPNEVTKVDLVEGRGNENSSRHFNCFDVAIKTFEDKSLGSEADSEENVRRFQQKFSNINPPPKPKKPEPKPEPVSGPKTKRIPPPDPDNPYPIGRLRDERDLVCGEKIVLHRLVFRDNSAEFVGLIQARQTLDEVFDYMRENPYAKLVLFGHSDIFGDKERNTELSRQRVLRVQQWLSGMGIEPERIEIQWFGSEQPVKAEGGELNRRVEMQMSCD